MSFFLTWFITASLIHIANINKGKLKKNRKNPNDPALFIWKDACTEDGEVADIHYYLDETKVAEEAGYDGLYAVCTDLIDYYISRITKITPRA